MTSILLTGTGTSIEQHFVTPIVGDYKLALHSLSMYYSWPNIDSTNNKLVYEIGGTQKTIALPEGAYTIEDIAKEIKINLLRMEKKEAFRLGINASTQKVSIEILEEGYTVIMINSGLRFKLGWTEGNLKLRWTTDHLKKGEHTAPNKVNITDINEVLVHCDVIRGIYSPAADSKLVQRTTLTSFYPNVAPGYKINLERDKLFYCDVYKNEIQSIKVWLTDQDYKPINNSDEKLTLKLILLPK